MTKTIAQQLKEKNEALQDLTRQPTQIALSLKAAAEPHFKEIRQDKMLSTDGRKIKFEEAQRDYSHQLYENVRELKTQYMKGVNEGRDLAKKTLVDPMKRPEHIGVYDAKLFEMDLDKLKVALAFSKDGTAVASKLNAFLAKYNDTYHADAVYREFTNLTSLALANGDSQSRLALSTVYEQISKRALDEDKRMAQDFLDGYKDAESYEFFKDYSPAYQSALGLLGGGNIKYINDPDAYFAQQESAETTE
ncbi:hypothetical protein ACIQ4I_10400 [Rummeliibacillus sp. NPDC094406]|uniref:hypothetical protein n=1 Tax=Rummeliibacillus sp. NPDC094406 TaxID=3364511 RepID=UPI0037F68062